MSAELHSGTTELATAEKAPVWLVALLGALLFILVPIFCPSQQTVFGEFGENDFLEYWTAYQLMSKGQDLYDPQLVKEVEERNGWMEDRPLMMWNPPWALTLLSPILSRPFDQSSRLFLGLNLALAMLTAVLSALLVGAEGAGALAIAVACLTSFPLYLLLLKGQISLLPTAALMTSLWALRRGRPVMAGVVLPVVSVKPHLAFLLFIPLGLWAVAAGLRRFVPALLLSSCFLAGGTLMAFPSSLGDWWSRGAHRSSPLLIGVESWRTSTLSFQFRNLTFLYTGRFLIWPMWVVPAIAAVLVLALAAFVFRTQGAQSFLKRVDSFGAVLIPLSLASAPFGWIFDGVAAFLSTAYVLKAASSKHIGAISRLALFSLLAALQGGTLWYGLTYDPTLEYYWFYAPCLAILAYAAWALQRAAPRDEDADGEAVLPPSPPGKRRFGQWDYGTGALIALAGALVRLPHFRFPPLSEENRNILIGLFPDVRRVFDPVREARPFLAFQFALASILPGDPLLLARIESMCFALVSILLFFLVIRRSFGFRPALVVSSLLALHPYFVLSDSRAVPDSLLTMCILAVVAGFVLHERFPSVLFERAGKAPLPWLTSSVFLGLGLSTSVSALVMFPFVFLLLAALAAHGGVRARLDLGLVHRAITALAGAVIVLYFCCGTFSFYGIELFAPKGPTGGGNPPSTLLDELSIRLRAALDFAGTPASLLLFGLLFGGLFVREARPFVLLAFLFPCIASLGARGPMPDVSIVFDWLLVFIALAPVLGSLQSLSARGAVCVAISLVLLFGFRSLVVEPLHPNLRDSSLGELSTLVDRELANHRQLVVFGCEFRCPGMLDLLRRSYRESRLRVLPLEISSANRALTLGKAIQELRRELGRETEFAVLLESGGSRSSQSLESLGFRTSILSKGSHDSLRAGGFELIKIDSADLADLLRAAPSEPSVLEGGMLSPKSDLRLRNRPDAGTVRFAVPRDLPYETRIELAVNGKPLVSGTLRDLPSPIPLPEISLPVSSEGDLLSVRCDDWVLAKRSGAAGADSSICGKLIGALDVADPKAE